VKEAKEKWRQGESRLVDGKGETEVEVMERLERQFKKTQQATQSRALRQRVSCLKSGFLRAEAEFSSITVEPAA
jgi:hypothetical protein